MVESETTVFRITHDPIEPPLFSNSAVGAVASFEGRVRDNHQGRSVVKLEYEAYEDLAVQEGNKIVAHALRQFGLIAAECTHRVGPLEVGDIAVRVDVLAGHRKEAFEACAWIIDQVKESVPIWKKETYAEGDHDWVNAQNGAEK